MRSRPACPGPGAREDRGEVGLKHPGRRHRVRDNGDAPLIEGANALRGQCMKPISHPLARSLLRSSVEEDSIIRLRPRFGLSTKPSATQHSTTKTNISQDGRKTQGSNALQTRTGSELKITVHKRASSARTLVWNTGVPIPPGVLGHLNEWMPLAHNPVKGARGRGSMRTDDAPGPQGDAGANQRRADHPLKRSDWCWPRWWGYGRSRFLLPASLATSPGHMVP